MGILWRLAKGPGLKTQMVDYSKTTAINRIGTSQRSIATVTPRVPILKAQKRVDNPRIFTGQGRRCHGYAKGSNSNSR